MFLTKIGAASLRAVSADRTAIEFQTIHGGRTVFEEDCIINDSQGI